MENACSLLIWMITPHALRETDSNTLCTLRCSHLQREKPNIMTFSVVLKPMLQCKILDTVCPDSFDIFSAGLMACQVCGLDWIYFSLDFNEQLTARNPQGKNMKRYMEKNLATTICSSKRRQKAHARCSPDFGPGCIETTSTS